MDLPKRSVAATPNTCPPGAESLPCCSLLIFLFSACQGSQTLDALSGTGPTSGAAQKTSEISVRVQFSQPFVREVQQLAAYINRETTIKAPIHLPLSWALGRYILASPTGWSPESQAWAGSVEVALEQPLVDQIRSWYNNLKSPYLVGKLASEHQDIPMPLAVSENVREVARVRGVHAEEVLVYAYGMLLGSFGVDPRSRLVLRCDRRKVGQPPSSRRSVQHWDDLVPVFEL